MRREHVAFVVLKRYNTVDPVALPFIQALAREGRRIAVFSPYRDTSGTRPEPFLHNTDARIDASLERPGPVVEIWQVDVLVRKLRDRLATEARAIADRPPRVGAVSPATLRAAAFAGS